MGTADRAEDQDLAILDGLFTQSPIGLAVYDSELRLVRMNAAMEAIHGIPREQMLGRRLSEFLPDLDTAAVEERLRRVLSTGRAEVDAVVTGRTPADPAHEHVWSVSSFALTDRDGRVIGVTDAVIDATERYRSRQRLAFLDEAATRIGTTLDVRRTAAELTQALVPRLADLASVDLLDGVEVGEDPAQPTSGSAGLRLAAREASDPTVVRGLKRIGDLQDFPADSPHAKALADGQPRLLREIDPNEEWIRTATDLPVRFLLERGVRSVMVVPLRARQTTLGLVHLYRAPHAEPFADDDLPLVRELVARAAVCVDNARRYTREHAVAVTLHESLLPRPELRQSAVDLAYRYTPARAHAGGSGAGIMVITLPGARVALVVSDVPAEGVQATVCTAFIGSAVRTLSELDLTPEELLARLDDMVPRLAEAQHPATSAPIAQRLVGTTCLYAVYDPITRRCTMASAGHPAPVIADPSGQVHLPQLPGNKPLGMADPVFESVEVELAEGSALVFHTAGLLRAFGTTAAMLDRLRVVLARSGLPVDAACQALTEVVVPHLSAEDDLALLLTRTRSLPADHVATWDLPRDPAAVADMRALALQQLRQWKLEYLAFTTELIISELVTNAIRYGSEPLRLRLIHDRTLICEVSDASSTSPHIRRAAATDEGGRGLFLVAECSHRWGVRYHATGKTIWAEQLLTS
jgi:PAS domain S-box-containing protein